MVDDSVVVEIIKYIPLQQGLRQIIYEYNLSRRYIIKYIPLQQGLRLYERLCINECYVLLSIFHYNKD